MYLNVKILLCPRSTLISCSKKDSFFWNLNIWYLLGFPELLQEFALGLARVAFLQNVALLTINKTATWQASFFRNREQSKSCNYLWKIEEVEYILWLWVNLGIESEKGGDDEMKKEAEVEEAIVSRINAKAARV